MSIASSTYSVITDNFYRVSFIQVSLSVREDFDWKIEWVVVDVPMFFFPTCLQTWSKLGDDCIKETLWWYGIFEKQWSLRINFFMRCKRTVMAFDDMLPRQARYFYLNQAFSQDEQCSHEGFILIVDWAVPCFISCACFWDFRPACNGRFIWFFVG